KHFIFEPFFLTVPINIKKLSKSRIGTILQDILPPLVFSAFYSHVVWNNIEYLHHFMLLQKRAKLFIFLYGANEGIELIMLCYIIPMRAYCLKNRRKVYALYSKIRKVGENMDDFFKRKGLIYLH